MRSPAPLALLAFALTLMGCKGAASKAAPEPPPAQAQAPRPDAAASPYFAPGELVAMGARITPLENGQSLICGGAGGNSINCLCQEPLPCEAAGNCISFEENIKAFRAALAKPAKGTSVDCRRAEVGGCGPFRYFDFEGDVERHELRWFDAAGRLVGQRNQTDHPAYCGGRSRKMLLGRVPRCEVMTRQTVLCGKAESPLATVLDEVLLRPPRR